MNIDKIICKICYTHYSGTKGDPLLTISKERLEKRLGALDKERMSEVDKALKLSLSLY